MSRSGLEVVKMTPKGLSPCRPKNGHFEVMRSFLTYYAEHLCSQSGVENEQKMHVSAP